jgi:hypothetical protein
LGSRRLGFTLRTPLITLEITLEELKRLHIHEEIIPGKKRELVNKMPRDGVFIHPIIVDSESLVVLDGMHRVAAAKQIGFHYIPICLVDYSNPHIEIGCWYRMFKGLSNSDEASEAIIEAELEPAEKTYEEAHRMIEQREAVTTIFSESWNLVARGYALDIKGRYDVIKKLERVLQVKGHQMGYSTDNDAQSRIASGEYSYGLMTPTVTKKEVVETALAGKVFAQKTTRHIIPARPMNVNIPITWLLGDMNLEEVNRCLREYLSSKKIGILPPGQILDRRYDEELYIFK